MTLAESAQYLGLTDDELPAGWRLARLGDDLVEDVQPGFACGINTREASGVPHLRPMNVSREGLIGLADLKFVPAAEVDRDQRWLRRGDVLFNNTNSAELVGKTAFYDDPEPRAFSNHMTRVRCRAEALDPHFCARALHYLWQTGYFESMCSHHVSQASVGRAALLDTAIPLPRVSEQQRIVAKIEELLARVNVARKHLARVPPILTRFRQSVLAAACAGRLTGDLRERQEGRETGETLLAQIRRDRAAEAGRRGGAEAIAREWVPAEERELPATWTWVHLDELLDYRRSAAYGVLQPGSDLDVGIPMVRVCDIQDGRVLVGQLKRIAPSIEAQYRRTRLQGQEVLVTLVGTIGRTAVVPPEAVGANIARAIAMLPLCPGVSPRFVECCLAEPTKNTQLVDLAREVARKTLNLGLLKAVQVPLAPLGEQHEIVRRVEVLFALAGAMEQRVAAATARGGRLTQSILAKAFRGELVPTDAELQKAGADRS